MTMIDHLRYATLKPGRLSYGVVLLVCIAAVVLGGYSALTMEHAGHIITGMNNHVVWGLPHVFAVSLIVAASGALNGASLASVFGLSYYKPIARLSVALAMSLLVGGLLVLVLDLGRPDRLIVAMTTYNFRSIFAWNIFLYTGFLFIGACYLWMMMERRFNHHIKAMGRVAFAWRIVLTTGTGSIFGFLVGRNALDSALLAPLFVALSLVMGTAALTLVLVMLDRWQATLLNDQLLGSLRRLFVWFLIALVYFSIVHHVTNLYATEHHSVERYTLMGQLSGMFWIGHIFVGVVLPLGVLLLPTMRLSNTGRLVISASLALLGGLALLYVVIIGSQSTPQMLFPGKTILASRFGDAGFPTYHPSVWEWGLGIGGLALAVLSCLLVLRVLPLLPESQRIENVSSE
ncbi:MAG: NrfD/PsrC family molybdoenzyme membrane anchor subunit [Granulosicoccaceae bacterium]